MTCLFRFTDKWPFSTFNYFWSDNFFRGLRLLIITWKTMIRLILTVIIRHNGTVRFKLCILLLLLLDHIFIDTVSHQFRVFIATILITNIIYILKRVCKAYFWLCYEIVIILESAFLNNYINITGKIYCLFFVSFKFSKLLFQFIFR